MQLLATYVKNQKDKYFLMKKGSIRDPDIYLGLKLRIVTLCNGVITWSASTSKYGQEAVRNLELYLEKQGKGIKLPNGLWHPGQMFTCQSWMTGQS